MNLACPPDSPALGFPTPDDKTPGQNGSRLAAAAPNRLALAQGSPQLPCFRAHSVSTPFTLTARCAQMRVSSCWFLGGLGAGVPC